MDSSEFRLWLQFFDACFPTYAEKRRNGAREATEGVWLRIMADVELGKAKVATESALRGDIGEITTMTGWDKYPGIIRKRAKDMAYANDGRGAGPSIRSRGPDGEPTYSCGKCRDTGWREIVSQKSIDDSKNFEVWMETGFVWPSLAACSCEGGQKFSTWKKPIPLKRSEMRQAIDFPGILDRPRTPIAWRNWLLDQVRKSHEWNPDSQPTEYVF